MQTVVVPIPTERISDWSTFHSVFQEILGFPDFYGRNMNAWVDCMTNIDDPSSGMTRIAVEVGDLVALRIDQAADFRRRCPEQYDALIECTSFVNYRRVAVGEGPVLTLMLCDWFSKPS